MGGQEFCWPWDCPCWEETRLLLLDQKSSCIFIWSKVEVWAGVSAVSCKGGEQVCAACSAARALSTQGSEEGGWIFWLLLWAGEPRL